MRFLRFSIRRLLLLTGLVAVLLYFLFIRPVTVAKSFVYKLEHADSTEISNYLDNVDISTDGAHVECELVERSWADVFSFKQTFAISVVGPIPERSVVSRPIQKGPVLGPVVSPVPEVSTIENVEKHLCTSTPFGVNQPEQYVYAEVREKKQ